MGIYIVISVIALALLGLLAYYGARFLKGKLELELSRSSADSGQIMTGRVTLEAKKPIRGLLKVSLVGREKRSKLSSSSDSSSTEMVEVYRQDVILAETRQFEAGFREDYTFEIVAPSQAEARSGGSALRAAADAMGGGAMGAAIKAAAGAADFMSGRIYWHIESRLDADGIDLFKKRKCQVNLRD